MADQLVAHWLEKLERVMANVDSFQHIDRMTPRLWMKYNEVTDDIRKLQSFLEHEKGYLDGKIIELGEEIPQKIQE